MSIHFCIKRGLFAFSGYLSHSLPRFRRSYIPHRGDTLRAATTATQAPKPSDPNKTTATNKTSLKPNTRATQRTTKPAAPNGRPKQNTSRPRWQNQRQERRHNGRPTTGEAARHKEKPGTNPGLYGDLLNYFTSFRISPSTTKGKSNKQIIKNNIYFSTSSFCKNTV